MIEATSENIWYKKKKRRFRLKRGFSFILICAIFVGLYFYYNRAICGQIINICKDYAYSYSTDSVNKAVLTSLTNKVNYDELINIEKNEQGDIVLISTNSYKVNLINREVAKSTQDYLENKIQSGTPVPLFAFTGISLLAGYGNPVKVKTLSVSSVTCQFKSEFNSVGINQTLHSIYVLVDSLVLIEMPFKSQEVRCQTSVMICESILVGKVPDTYLSGSLFPIKNI